MSQRDPGKEQSDRSPIQVSRRAAEIRPFIVMEVLERAQELERLGRKIVHLEVGEPDFETPDVIREAGIRAIRDGHTHYTHSLGRRELREAIAEWYVTRYGVAPEPDQVIVTVGSSGAMQLIFAALLNFGDEVLLPDPGYPCYEKFIRAFGGVPVPVPLREEENFNLEPAAVRDLATSRTRALILNSPSNPTGAVASRDRLAGLNDETAGSMAVVSDEIYHGLVYEGEAHSMLEFNPDALIVSGFSKLFAMTGWRLGYAIVPRPLVRPIQKLQQNLFISAPDFAQVAAVAALRSAGPDLKRMRQEYDRRRKYLLARLAEMGLQVAGFPEGAFYLLINVREVTRDVYKLAFRILEEAGVAVTPGVDFGANGEGYLRICYATSMEQLEEGMDRLERFFKTVQA